MKQYEAEAHKVVEAIKTIASKPANLDNLESYLSQHFDKWLEKYGSTPDGLAEELASFATMEV